jgi:regulator of protease activity HflC (stomatin/prohibitin superfamily)
MSVVEDLDAELDTVVDGLLAASGVTMRATKAQLTARAAVLEAEGQAKAIQTVFNAIHAGKPDNLLLAYQYLQTLPKIAQSASNKMWFIPSEFTEALRGIGEGFATRGTNPFGSVLPSPDAAADASATSATDAEGSPDLSATDYSGLVDQAAEAAVAEAEREATKAENAAPAGLPPVTPAPSGEAAETTTSESPSGSSDATPPAPLTGDTP